MNTTYDLPLNLGDLMGAYDEAHWQTYVGELKPNSGVLTRGSVLSMVAGKLELTKATTEDAAFGILLDLQIDTASPLLGWISERKRCQSWLIPRSCVDRGGCH